MADASLVPVWAFSMIDANGEPLVGAKLFTYEVNVVLTVQKTYKDSTLLTEHNNPILTDAAGRFPDPVYAQNKQYKFVLKDADDNTLQTIPVWQPNSLLDPVTTYTALKALDVGLLTEGMTLYIDGRATPDDGGQGHFYATEVNPGADDDGIILHSDTAGWYFVRQDKTSVHIGAFGGINDGDGVGGGTDNAAAFENALNTGYPIEMGHGSIYMVARPWVITATRYKLFSKQTQRGANALGQETTYKTATIDYQPATATDFMIDKSAVLNTPSFLIGPYEHENITFLFTLDANGIRFGDPTQDPIDATTQSYLFGVKFKGCAFHGTIADSTSVSGVITRTGQELLSLTKCFSPIIDDCSFIGGDYQIKARGCDNPMFSNGRSQHGNVPFDLDGSGTFNTKHSIDNWQFEGWMSAPVNSYGTCNLVASNIRIEQTTTPTGSEVYDLTAALSITASVTADSASMTFNQAMDNILFPDESIIRITDGTNTDDVLVKTVSGTTVTFWGDTFTLTWTDATASVSRIHSYGPLHNSVHDASYSGVSGKGGDLTPGFVYVMNRGSMSISNAQMQKSGDSYGGGAIVIGNHFKEAQYLNQSFSFSGCTPFLLPNPNHPVVSTDNWRADNGVGQFDGTDRSKLGPLDVAFQVPLRKWAFIPKDTAAASNNSHLHPFKEIDGDTNTSQKIWAWHKRSGSGILLLDDTSLPGVSAQWIRILIKARAETGTPTLGWAFRGAGASSATSIGLTTALSTTEYIQQVPTEWSGAKTLDFGFGFTGDTYYLAGVSVKEITAAEALSIPSVVTDTLTIASGAITVNTGLTPANYYKLAGEGASADSVDTISGGFNGQRIIFQADDGAIDITVATGGNIRLDASAGNFLMDGLSDAIELFYDGTRSLWTETWRAANTT